MRRVTTVANTQNRDRNSNTNVKLSSSNILGVDHCVLVRRERFDPMDRASGSNGLGSIFNYLPVVELTSTRYLVVLLLRSIDSDYRST